MLQITDMDFNGQVVLLRTDYNVPIENGEIKDDRRIQASVETIRYILNNHARQVIIISHLGRPKGKVVKDLRLNAVADRLSELLGTHVVKLDDCIDIKIPAAKVVLLENLRFHSEEEDNDAMFARKLAVNADIFVNDAFSVSHRAHASVVGVTKLLPSCAGFHFIRETINLSLDGIKKPAVAVMGGAKVSTKIKLIESILKKVDIVLIGGAMMFTFLKSMGFEIGKSKFEKEDVDIAKRLIEKNKKKIVLPIDVVVADKIDKDAEAKNISVEKMSAEDIGVDIGEATVKYYKQVISGAKTVIWNGPMGVMEIPQFAKGTEEIAKHIASISDVSIVGGGDTANVIDRLGLSHHFTFVSTAGGAALQYLEGTPLPGITALDESEKNFD